MTLTHLCGNVSGEDGSGKTTIMSKLQGAEHNKKGRGLEYLYLNVHDEDIDGKFPVPVAKNTTVHGLGYMLFFA